MNKFKVKICGIKNTSTIDSCIKNKVDFFGLVFFKKSPRNINLKNALKLINYVTAKKITPVGVFVNKPLKELMNIIKKTKLTYIQLHGKEDNDYINLLKNNFNIKIIKSIGINKRSDFLKMKKLNNSDYFLFDYKAKSSDLPGGNAKSFNWSLLKNTKIDKPWFISGGINSKNINQINKKIIPYGIDISSGVEEKPGIKNPKKINELIEKIDAK